MTPSLVLFILAAYFGLMLVIAHFTSKEASNQTFFTADRKSPWYLVAFGMIGASLSGVTFISVPGEVGNSQFAYFQLVLGYILGYSVIATVLMPLYYRLNLISIYTFLEQRFGFWSYKTGAVFFLISKIVGASFRLFLAAGVLQIAVFNSWNVPFWVTVTITILLIWLYTFRGGIKTIVWTDTLQTTFMVSAVLLSIFMIKDELGMTFSSMAGAIQESSYSKIFFWDWKTNNNFFKQFFSGAFIAIVMTGLDQDMMQKNLTCRSLKDAQKNMFSFTAILVVVNFIFLSLGALLFIYAHEKGVAIPERTDDLYPLLALNHFSTAVGILFLLGIIAAAYSSADSALAGLTTSFCVDILNFKDQEEDRNKKTRMAVHVGFSLVLLVAILIFNSFNDRSVITAVFLAAGYTYGPLLGLYAFGMFTKLEVKDKWVPLVCIISPVLSFWINLNSEALLGGYKFGFEILIVNGLLTFLGLLMLTKRKEPAIS